MGVSIFSWLKPKKHIKGFRGGIISQKKFDAGILKFDTLYGQWHSFCISDRNDCRTIYIDRKLVDWKNKKRILKCQEMNTKRN